jgi:DNA-directed RNA polymerase subunit RPC12/RpoP
VIPLDDRCELTELRVDECAHCQGDTLDLDVDPDDLGPRGPMFRARYDGKCARCGRPFPEGAYVARLRETSGYVHEHCPPGGQP